jgi:hypothetical protein
MIRLPAEPLAARDSPSLPILWKPKHPFGYDVDIAPNRGNLYLGRTAIYVDSAE